MSDNSATLRERKVTLCATEEELAQWKTAARAAGLSLSAYIRTTIYRSLTDNR